mgnify:CR=1 FL=1
MYAYVFRRLILIIPTLLGIMLINFAIVQFVPGGPVEQMISQITGENISVTARVGGDAGQEAAGGSIQKRMPSNNVGLNQRYRGAQGLPAELIADIERQFGMDKPPFERFFLMIRNYISFDFGDSFFQNKSVVNLVIEKMPVSISLGLWTTLLVYLISIPLGISKATRDGSKFDVWTSSIVIFGNAVPGFLFAILLIVIFSGGRYLDWFPLRGLTSQGFDDLTFAEQVFDYFWHLTLPLISMVIGGFAGLTMLTKNSFIEEINKQYVITARAKGLTETRVLYGHVFRNAMLIVIAGFPSAFVGILFTGAMLTEIIFSLDGLGLLGFEAALKRDYPVMFGTLFFFTLVGLLLGIIGDVMYHLIDPRIDFESREL